QQGVNAGLTTTTTEYLDGFQYKDGVLQFFPTTEGYVNAITAGSVAYNYVYNLTDHLGNVRVSYAWDDVNSKLKTVNEDHYYPFGLQHKGYNKPPKDIAGGELGEVEIGIGIGSNSGSANYKYRYNGKELQDELGLNWYDYQWRNYDPAIARWFNIDPASELMRRHSPYNYTFNNPIRYTDPDGMLPDDIIRGQTKSDATQMKADIHNVLKDEKFSKVRDLIDIKGKEFKSIDSGALASALDGVQMSTDEQAYVEMVTNTINSSDIHTVEYLSGEFTSTDGASAFKEHMNSAQEGVGDAMLTREGQLKTSVVEGAAGEGLNIPTKKGSHSFISSSVKGDVRASTSTHEVFGHGIPSAQRASSADNNANAIRADNLSRRILGLPERDGANHGGYSQGHITDPNKLPLTK
ncbi:RHS repeat domain-containing protein, partial [Empedobacter brevis]|uniref:RHS repeat domain-containing protein n=1 Tax=Empedobacter brevis TaxID=247 RepID=UPI00333EB5D0